MQVCADPRADEFEIFMFLAVSAAILDLRKSRAFKSLSSDAACVCLPLYAKGTAKVMTAILLSRQKLQPSFCAVTC